MVLGISRTWSTPCTVSGRSLRSADLGDARVFPPAEETGGRSSTSAKLVSIRVFPIIEEMTRPLFNLGETRDCSVDTMFTV